MVAASKKVKSFDHGRWNRVFIKSNGWRRTVDTAPAENPAMPWSRADEPVKVFSGEIVSFAISLGANT